MGKLAFTGDLEPQIGDFGGAGEASGVVPIGIPLGARLDVAVTLIATYGRTLTAKCRNGITEAIICRPGTSYAFDGRQFGAVSIDSADSRVLYALVSQDSPPTWGSPTTVTPYGTLNAANQFLGAVANGTGLTTVEVGTLTGRPTRVYYSAGRDGPTTTPGSAVLVGIYDNTNSDWILVNAAPVTIAGYVDVPPGIDVRIAYQNGDTIAHYIAATARQMEI